VVYVLAGFIPSGACTTSMQGRGASVHALQRSAVHERTMEENMVTCTRSWTGRALLKAPGGQPCERTHARTQAEQRQACAAVSVPAQQPKAARRRRAWPGREAADRALGAVTLCSLGSGAKSNGSREVCVWLSSWRIVCIRTTHGQAAEGDVIAKRLTLAASLPTLQSTDAYGRWQRLPADGRW